MDFKNLADQMIKQRGFTYPRNITIGVGVVVVEDGHFLILKRIGGKWPDTHALVGGHPEEGECVHDAAIRETLEEVGLIVAPFPIENSYIFHTKEHISRAKGFHHYSVYVAAKIVGGELVNREPEKHCGLRWTTLEDAEKLARPIDVLLPLPAIRKFRHQIGL
jgi:ADP-ribose pyrophosphatase YjhB (NUDIX family)